MEVTCTMGVICLSVVMCITEAKYLLAAICTTEVKYLLAVICTKEATPLMEAICPMELPWAMVLEAIFLLNPFMAGMDSITIREAKQNQNNFLKDFNNLASTDHRISF